MSKQKQKTTARAASETMKPRVDANSWVRLTLKATLGEDAHLGSGQGGRGIDALIARDRVGRPVIWATHLEGLLRDHARRLSDRSVEKRLFGSRGGQRQLALFTSLYASKDNIVCRVWRSSRRKAFDNRAPDDDTLRAIEMVSKGTLFTGEVEIQTRDVEILKRLLLETGAVGGGRSPGAGRVKFTVTLAAVQGKGLSRPGSNTRLTVLLRNLDPVSVANTATPDNLIPSLAFIPGRTLAGSMAAWALTEGKTKIAELLTDGRLTISDALPVHARLASAGSTSNDPRQILPSAAMISRIETIPAPLCLQTEKPAGIEDGVPWWAAPSTVSRVNSDRDARTEDDKRKLKRPEDDRFLWRLTSDLPWIAFQPLRPVRLRSGRTDPTQSDPGLFATEQIAEDTLFVAHVDGTPEQLAQLAGGLSDVLEGMRWLRVGRGGAPVEVARHGYSHRPDLPAPAGEGAYLTLTSDLLIRDDRLRWLSALAPDPKTSKTVGFPGWPPGVSATPVVQDESMVNGFNGTARLWRLSAVGIRRGSVFKVDSAGAAALAEAARGEQWKWLGERTHEGFGRFRLDAELPGVSTVPAPAPTPQSDDPDEAIADRTRGWMSTHPQLAVGKTTDVPSRSQWQELASAIQSAPQHAVATLNSRLSPTTLGASRWHNTHARQVIEKLKAQTQVGIAPESVVKHVRYFVRWLNAEARRHGRES